MTLPEHREKTPPARRTVPAEYMPERYWDGRKHMRYYAEVRAMLEALSPAGSLLDVGGWDTPVATWGTFARRYTCDLARDPKFNGVRSHVGDFLTWTPPERMSVATCLQVLEHLPDGTVNRFARRLLAAADVVIITVPYLWPGTEPSHFQDPISHEKLARIMGREPDRSQVIMDGKRGRIVALYRTEQGGWPK